MRTWPVVLVVLALPLATLLPPAPAQQNYEAQVVFNRFRHFKIPFNLGPGKDRLRQLQLFYSTDRGKNWRPSSVAGPDKNNFPFLCERDGLYWFTVQTLDNQGKLWPPNLTNAVPSLKVVVDSLPPVVQLRPLPPRQGKVGVAWDIREEHLDYGDPRAIRLDYRAAGDKSWTPLPINRIATYHYWNPHTTRSLQVRLRVMDRAENRTEVSAQVSADDNAVAFPADNQRAPRGGAAPGGDTPYGYANAKNRRLINSKEIRLNCEVEQVGPSGVSELELWYTTDGRSWNRYPLGESAVKDLHSDTRPAQLADERRNVKKQVHVDVEREGVFGFTIVAKSGVGRSRQPPRLGEPPQIWIEVDLTRPTVELQDVTVVQGIEKKDGKLQISWNAYDKNLGRDPIQLSYAEHMAGPWQPIVRNIPNTGRYLWTMPQSLPYQFYVRIEATDMAGNVGDDTTREMVKVDLSQPKVNILQVEPGG